MYFAQFHDNPKLIARIIEKSIDLGVTGIQLLPYPHIVSAIRLLPEEMTRKLTIIGTIRIENPRGDIELLKKLGSVAMLLHGELTDSHDFNMIRRYLDLIGQAGAMAGLATHRPMRTLTWLREVGLRPDVIMFPFNKIGKFMDSDPEKVLEAAVKLGAVLIGKKILAAGSLSPREGLEYTFQKGIHSVAIGVASEEEAEETFSIASELSSRYH